MLLYLYLIKTNQTTELPMINTVINNISISYAIDSAMFSTHPNLLMGGAIKGRLKRNNGVEVYFNTYCVFQTQEDNRFAFKSLSNMNFFVVSREPLEVTTQQDIHSGVKMTDIDSDLQRKLIVEILTEIGYSQYTHSHTKEVVLKAGEPIKATPHAAKNNGVRSEAYQAVSNKTAEYHAIKKDIQRAQIEAAELKGAMQITKKKADDAAQAYQEAQQRIQAMLLDAVGVSEQLTQLSIIQAREF